MELAFVSIWPANEDLIVANAGRDVREAGLEIDRQILLEDGRDAVRREADNLLGFT